MARPRGQPDGSGLMAGTWDPHLRLLHGSRLRRVTSYARWRGKPTNDSVVYIPEGGTRIAIGEIQVDQLLDVAVVHLESAVRETWR